jgi:hypothetical protein
MTRIAEVNELYELNVELLETLLVLGCQILDYAEKHGIPLEGKDRLIWLTGNAQRIMEEIAKPYRGSPIRRTEDSPPRGNAIECPIGGYPRSSVLI